MEPTNPLLLGLRGAQFVLGFIVFCMSCYTVNKSGGEIDEANFMLFNGLWTFLLAVPYLALCVKFFPDLAHKFILVAVDAVTMIFWFAGFIALGAELPGPKACTGSPCHSLQAITVFGAFEWVFFAATTALAVIALIRQRSSSSKPPPAMEIQAGV
jgi:hypothetical protein